VPFAIQVSPRAKENLKALRKRDQQIIVDAIRLRLTD
jgi:mRNA-degrading endonuclease RelE of RelBE toxin-antitoxin system